MPSSRISSLVPVALLFFLTASASPASEPDAISFNFSSQNENSMVGADETAGVIPCRNWNNVIVPGPVSEKGFITSRGVTVDTTLIFPKEEQARRGATIRLQTAPDASHRLFATVVNVPLVISGIPKEFTERGYTLYVYFRQPDERNWPMQVTVKVLYDDESIPGELIGEAWGHVRNFSKPIEGEVFIRATGISFGDGDLNVSYAAFEGLTAEKIEVDIKRWINEGTTTNSHIAAIQIVAN